MAAFDLSVTGVALETPPLAEPSQSRDTTVGRSTTPSTTVFGATAPAAMDLSRVELNETQQWCYHEGSHGHNPEYGNTHTLTRTKNKSFVGSHTQVQSKDHCGVEKNKVAGVETFWKIHTSGEMNVPTHVSATERIGHTHQITLEGDTLTVIVNYGRTREQRTTILSVAALYREYSSRKKVIEFSV